MTNDGNGLHSRGDQPTGWADAQLQRFITDGAEIPPDMAEEHKAVLLKPGDMVADRFEVSEQLGFGGMGAVYKVKDRITGQDRALKVMLPSLLKSDAARERFVAEVTITQELSHQGIVRVHDIGEDPARGFRFFTMEYIQGVTLHRLLQKRNGRLPLKETLHIALALCRTLRHAHKHTVHRDLKPQNVMVRGDWTVKVLDFGLAKVMSPGRMTKSSMALGTAYYQAPEQSVHLAELDQRADIYSLGVMLYEMVTGKLPIGRFPDPSDANPECPKPLDDAILKCLMPEPEQRYANVGELMTDLTQVAATLGKDPEQQEPQQPQQPQAPQTSERPKQAATPQAPPAKRSKLLLILPLALVALAILLVFGGMFSVRTPQRAGSPGTVPSESASADETGLSPDPETPRVALTDSQSDPSEETSPATVPALSTEEAQRLQRDTAPNGEITKTVDLGDGVTMEFMWIPPGSFMMGSPYPDKAALNWEKPEHKVTISRGFWMGKYEVTQEQWQAVMGDNPSDSKGDTKPVEWVSWDDCQEFLVVVGGGLRLPTEAEWEYACRAGNKGKYCFGGYEGRLGDYAWYDDNSEGTTHPVGQKEANAWGLHDLHGNVYEWCEDWYDPEYYQSSPSVDPEGPESAPPFRVKRGGAHNDDPRMCRSAARDGSPPDFRNSNIGFRAVLAAESGTQATSPKDSASGDGTRMPASAADPATIPALSTEKAQRLQRDTAPNGEITKTIDLGDGVTMEFMWIPPGEFMMGSPDSDEDAEDDEKPQHKVTVSKGFWMGKYEVTEEQWRAVLGSRPTYSQGDLSPAVCRSWDDSQHFIKRASAGAKEIGFRLPSEAEWEYACRAGTNTRFSFGDGSKLLGEYAWHGGNSERLRHPVGQKRANAWGLHDIHGNMSEWCDDWYGESFYATSPEVDPSNGQRGKVRGLRGGAYCDSARRCRSSSRYWKGTSITAGSWGFRVALTPAPVVPTRVAGFDSTTEEALREAKTASVEVGDFTIDGKPAAGHWRASLSGCFSFMLEAAGIERVPSNGDVVFALNASTATSSANYVAEGAVGIPNANSMRIATGATFAGELQIKQGGKALSTLSFEGSRGTTATYSMTSGSNPIIAALASSDFHRRLLDALVQARGPAMLDTIIGKYRMVLSVSTDWDGGMAAYRAVFDILAESKEPWARERLAELLADAESPSAKRLAEQAVERAGAQGELPTIRALD